MDIAKLLSQLEGLANKLGLRVRYESFGNETEDSPGGYCRLRDKMYVIVNRNLSLEAQAVVLGLALKSFDLEGVYMRPAVREFLSSALDLNLPKKSLHTEVDK